MTSDVSFLHGACHCGALRVEFGTGQDPATIHPRACDCSFCRKHGAAYVSDPAGSLSVTETVDGMLGDYRQGSNTAQFLLCRRCGILVAVLFVEESRTFGAVNSRCLDSDLRFGETVSASPQKLGADEKIFRWRQLWIADVKVRMFGDKAIAPLR
jgi:hypothetical protein